METKDKIEEEVKEDIKSGSNRCSDYDDECVLVPDHLFCWMGTKNCGRADGLCPFIHGEN